MRFTDGKNSMVEVLRRRHMILAAALVLQISGFAASRVYAHEAGAPFSGAIIDPFSLHHAHIENEQRINLFSLRGVDAGEGRKRSAFEGELEFAWSNATFDFGFEAFIPFVSFPSPEGDGRTKGIGDVEIRPIKYALINRPDFVLTTATALTLPTGDRKRGLGSGNTTVAQFLFVDKAVGNWFFGLNLGADARVGGESGSGVEYGAVVSYSFIHGTPSGGLAASRPSQPLVISPSLEFVGSKRLSGNDSGERETSISTGLNFWWPKSGWQVRAGVAIPISGVREADRTFLLQVGNHLNWGKILR